MWYISYQGYYYYYKTNWTKVVILQYLSVKANLNAWRVRICSNFHVSLSHHFSESRKIYAQCGNSPKR